MGNIADKKKPTLENVKAQQFSSYLHGANILQLVSFARAHTHRVRWWNESFSRCWCECSKKKKEMSVSEQAKYMR